MKIKETKIELENAKQAKLVVYLQEEYPEIYGERKRPMVLVCPGGGYTHVSPREAEPIAMQFLSAGCNAAVLWYDVADADIRFPQQVFELAVAVAYLRKRAEEFHIHEDKILLCGFSAGGHLAASLGCFWSEAWFKEGMQKMQKISPEEYKPNGLILAYPVITSGEYAHRGSFLNLLGEKAEEGCKIVGLSGKEMEQYVSLEHHVTEQVPPVFMWHTFEDQAVPLENSLLFAMALKKAGVSLEYHVFPHGGHGYALGTRQTAGKELKEIDTQIPQWIDLCKNWLDLNYHIF